MPQDWPILWAIVALIHIKPVYSSVSYQQVTNPKYDRRGHESLRGYGPYTLYEGPNLANERFGVFGRKLEGSHFPFNHYLGKYERI